MFFQKPRCKIWSLDDGYKIQRFFWRSRYYLADFNEAMWIIEYCLELNFWMAITCLVCSPLPTFVDRYTALLFVDCPYFVSPSAFSSSCHMLNLTVIVIIASVVRRFPTTLIRVQRARIAHSMVSISAANSSNEDSFMCFGFITL